MAEAYGNIVGHWRAHVTADIIRQDAGSVTIRVITYFQAVDSWDYALLNGSFSASVAGNGASGSKSMGIAVGVNGQQNLVSKDVRISKNHGSRTVSFNGSINITGYASGYSSAKGTISFGPKDSYTVSYNANGGTGAPGNQKKWYRETLTLSRTVPTRTNYKFLGWGTTAGQTGTNYNPGSLYSNDRSITLYAIWKLALVAPTIDDIKAFRCDANGNLSDSGTSVKVTCIWHVDRVADTSNVGVKMVITYDSTTDSNTITGTSGTFSKIYPSISMNTSHQFNATLTDKHMNVQSSYYVSPSYFIIDINANGSGVGIGQAAPPKGIIVRGTFFSTSLEGLPTTAENVGPRGTRAFVNGVRYIYDGNSSWKQLDTDWIDLGYGNGYEPAPFGNRPRIRVSGGLVFMQGVSSSKSGSIANGDQPFGLIPASYRPRSVTYATVNGTGERTVNIQVNASGTIGVKGTPGGGYVAADGCWWFLD